MVVHEGIIREKPTTKEEACQFMKGLFSQYLAPKCFNANVFLIESLSSPGYSGGHVSTVGCVVVATLVLPVYMFRINY